MVVIIDDRADVWEWSPNLIKVIPCSSIPARLRVIVYDSPLDDFFVGIGDINSTFLPKLEPLAPLLPAPIAPSSSETEILPLPSTSDPMGADTGSQDPLLDTAAATPLIIPEPPVSPETEGAELAEKAMLTRNSLALEAQLEDRPLAKKQEALSEGEAPHEPHHHHHKADHKPDTGVLEKEAEISTTPKPEKVERKALLKNDDYELERIAKASPFNTHHLYLTIHMTNSCLTTFIIASSIRTTRTASAN